MKNLPGVAPGTTLASYHCHPTMGMMAEHSDWTQVLIIRYYLRFGLVLWFGGIPATSAEECESSVLKRSAFPLSLLSVSFLPSHIKLREGGGGWGVELPP